MDNNIVYSNTIDERWKIISKDVGFWQIGIYKPEFNSAQQVNILEKHSCPEFFFCSEGDMGIILYDEDNKSESIVKLSPGDYITVTSFHNAFCLSDNGFFLVSERNSFTTDFITRPDYQFIKKTID